MTESYFDTLKRHGLKLSVAMFLGGLLYSAFYYVVLILYADRCFSPDRDIFIGLLHTRGRYGSARRQSRFRTRRDGSDRSADPAFFRHPLTAAQFLDRRSLWSRLRLGLPRRMVHRILFHDGIQALVENVRSANPLILFFIGPALLMLPFISFLAVNGLGSRPPDLSLAVFILLFVLSIGYLWISLHSPLIMIAERTGVWDSIRLAFRLTVKKPGQTLLSGLIALGISLGAYGLVLPIVFVLFILFDVLTGGNEIVRVILGIFLLLTILFVAYYALSASLLSIAHRYKTRLRSYLFPEDPDRERAFVGTTPGYAPNNW